MTSRRRRLTHVDESGRAHMVDVSAKDVTVREALAESIVRFPPAAYAALRENRLAKGDALATARIAAISAAKKTGELIPLCHPLPLDHVQVEFIWEPRKRRVRIQCRTRTRARTGVEMEALAAASVAALTLYDMAKAVSKGIVIECTRLLRKSGGKSGTWRARGTR